MRDTRNSAENERKSRSHGADILATQPQKVLSKSGCREVTRMVQGNLTTDWAKTRLRRKEAGELERS